MNSKMTEKNEILLTKNELFFGITVYFNLNFIIRKIKVQCIN